MSEEMGIQFAAAIAGHDRSALAELLGPELDFRAMTPSRFWESADADDVIDRVIFGKWFEDTDHIVSTDSIETDGFADVNRVRYRFQVENSDGRSVIEQQAYFQVTDSRISWLRIVCSGYRAVQDDDAAM
jgi:hypothetical protein